MKNKKAQEVVAEFGKMILYEMDHGSMHLDLNNINGRDRAKDNDAPGSAYLPLLAVAKYCVNNMGFTELSKLLMADAFERVAQRLRKDAKRFT